MSSSKKESRRGPKGMRMTKAVSKTGASFRGTGVCPVTARFTDLNVSETHDLGKASEGKVRDLTAIPEGYRMEATCIRVDETNMNFPPDMQFRGTVQAKHTGHAYGIVGEPPSEADLIIRKKPDWSGLHVNIKTGDKLVIMIQKRAHEGALWRDASGPITLEPLKAFKVQDHDVTWYPGTSEANNGHQALTVWVQLSLQKLMSAVHKDAEGYDLATKVRNVNFKQNIRQRSVMLDPEYAKAEKAKIQNLLDEPDAMTVEDKVVMKDVWNKCLGFIDLTGEFIVEGLLLRCPDLLDLFGAATSELAFDMMISLIDKAIRNLDERTEIIARESYRVVPLGSARPIDSPFHTLEEGFSQFADLGMRPHHWEEARTIFILAMQKANPYLEEADMESFEGGQKSFIYRFWTHHMIKPAWAAIKNVDEVFGNESNRLAVQKSIAPVLTDKHRAGMEFYNQLFTKYPQILPFFGTTDMNFLAGHLFDALELLQSVFDDFEKAIPVLHQLGKFHDTIRIPVAAYGAVGEIFHSVMKGAEGTIYGDGSPEGEQAVQNWAALMNRAVLLSTRRSFVSERLIRKAFEWSEQVAHELKWTDSYLEKRKIDIETSIRTTGTYSHTEEEVIHGCRVAWRNSAKCVGRIAWNTMLVRDRRHVTDLDSMFAECLEHQRLATADGSLKAVMTVFQPRRPGTRLGFRFWNAQLIRFACYKMPDGTYMGDQANLGYTEECIEFGWKPPEPRTEFDVLPIVIEDPMKGITKMFEVPKEYHKVTMIEHPKFPEFGKLGLRWCVVPTVTSFTLLLGGLHYTCCPFNGWFMETEIARDLLEAGRYGKAAAIARAVGIDLEGDDPFWEERVAIEANVAIMHSFRRDGHSIVDHRTAQGQFLAHDLREKREGRECPAQWSWVVPSFGGYTMPIWHHEMRDFYIEPQYTYQAEIHQLRKLSSMPENEILGHTAGVDSSWEKLLILFASVTGAAESYAYRTKKALRPLQVTVKNCKDVNPEELAEEFKELGGPYSALLFITSTFGEGDPPTSAVKFFEGIQGLPYNALSGVPFSVLAIGSRVYPHFCQAGINMDRYLSNCGAERILALKTADEVRDREDSVRQWIGSVGSHFDVEQKRAQVLSGDADEQEDEGPPVSVELLEDTDERVKAAIEEEAKLAQKAKGGTDTNGVGAVARFLPEDYRLCTVTRNSELVKFETAESRALYKSTRFLEFDLDGITKKADDSNDFTYETGDHAKLLPANPPSLVEEMCKCLQVEASQWVEVTIQEGSGQKLHAPIARVGDLLALDIDLATQEVDGNLPLLQKLLTIARGMGGLNEQAENMTPNQKQAQKHAVQVEIARLEDMCEELQDDSAEMERGRWLGGHKANLGLQPMETGRAASIKIIMERYMDVPSLLREFPITTSKLTLADCVEILPRIKPRHYSIASASELHPSSLQLTVGVLTVVHKTTNNKRHGLCSTYLTTRTTDNSSAEELNHGIASARATGFVRMGLSTSKFRLPPEMDYPVIMVGPGTGISPMLGFLQAREKAMENNTMLGPCMVFFGCRAEEDFLHAEQMRKWEKSGVITSLQVAFSRIKGQPKEYVQHRIGKIRGEIWAILSDPKCHYYVCGDSQMAEDVYSELYRTARVEGNLDHKDASDFLWKMKSDKRYQTDTWGVVTNRDEALHKLVDKKYNQAAEWLENYKSKPEESAPAADAVRIEAPVGLRLVEEEAWV